MSENGNQELHLAGMSKELHVCTRCGHLTVNAIVELINEAVAND
jgi:hypothetical protein